jgi:hypothetical protein
MNSTDGPGSRRSTAVAAAKTARVAGEGMPTIVRDSRRRVMRDHPEPDP